MIVSQAIFKIEKLFYLLRMFEKPETETIKNLKLILKCVFKYPRTFRKPI